MNREIRTTADGSSTLFVPELEEHYHSVHGAIQESLHVFLAAGFSAIAQKECAILEIGFGTGLNAWLTALAAENENRIVHFTSVEKYPISAKEIASLNFADQISATDGAEILQKIHTSSWGGFYEISPHFFLKKEEKGFAEIENHQEFDLIYFDAFAPSAQPDLWTEDIFAKMYTALKPGGILVTYCAKGQVKRNMKAVGFTIEALPGPPGKREMTRAKKG